METILVVEDDPSIQRGLELNLQVEGYSVITASDGEEGLKQALERRPDILLLDVMLPKLSGFDICRQIRKQGLTMPIIMLTAKTQEIDKIMGLELGADDYVTKPFSVRELLARVQTVLRRPRTGSQRSHPARDDLYPRHRHQWPCGGNRWVVGAQRGCAGDSRR